MPDIPRQQLQYIMTQFGRSVCDESKRCEALLKDLCPNHKREVRLLVVALREGVVKTLSYPPSFLTIENVITQLVQRLYDEWGIAVELGQWAVESWAIVLGVKFNKTTNTLITEKSVSQPNVAVKAVVTAQQKPISPIVSKQFEDWQKIGTNGEILPVDALQWAAVIDPKTKLMWAINPSKTADFPNPKNRMKWDDTKRWVDYVNSQAWCGFNEWRLPRILELKSILVDTKSVSLYLREDVFNDIDRTMYCVWTSSKWARYSNYVRVVDFSNATFGNDYISSYHYLRLVRSC